MLQKSSKVPPIGILQGRLTPSSDDSIQFFPHNNWQNEFGIAGEIGFDCVELLVKADSFESNPLWEPLEVQKTQELARENGLYIPSVHAFFKKSEEYSKILGKIINHSSILGVRTILISFFGENALVSEKDKNLARELLKNVLRLCEEKDIHLGIETEMETLELLRFVQSFKHPNVGVYYDIGNMASMGMDVAEEILWFGEYIRGVHIKDRKSHGGETVPLGEGCVDFGGAFKALKLIGYNGPLIIQGARKMGVDDVELNCGYLGFCRDLLEKTYGGSGK